MIRLLVEPVSLLCLLPLVAVEALPNGYLVGKDLVILLFECVVGKMFLASWERSSHSALRVCRRKNVLCLMYFMSYMVIMLGLFI